MQQMGEVVVGADQQNLQYLLSDAKWDHGMVQRQISRDVNERLGGCDDTFLIIDESAMGKKGEKSVGVARQWNGRLGKIDNCQVGVYAALSRGTAVSLVSCELYLPKSWAQDKKRCEAAGIPSEEIRFRTKSEIGRDMIRKQRAAGIRFAWVGVDGGYGKEPGFLRGMEDDGERFMADVHRTQRFFVEDPKPTWSSVGKGNRRCRPRLTTSAKPMTVEVWAKQLSPQAWNTIRVRHTTMGPLDVLCACQRVWLWDHEEEKPRQWTVLVVKEVDKPDEIHYALTNAPAGTPIEILAKAERHRFWVEHALGEAKSELGMAQYEVRTWTGWNRHMTLCMLAMLFTFEERIANANDIPLLSARDIRTVLAQLLPRHEPGSGEIYRMIHARHQQRCQATSKRYEKQGFPPAFNRFGDPTM